jgi:hypothetical protein
VDVVVVLGQTPEVGQSVKRWVTSVMGRGREEGKRTLGLATLLGNESRGLAEEEESDEAGLGWSARRHISGPCSSVLTPDGMS